MSKRTDYIDRIEQFPATLDAAVHHLTSEQLDTPYREGGWTVRQVVHHLADDHVIIFTRLKFILTEEHPTLKPFDQDHWAALHEARTGELGPSLMILRGIHQRTAEMLRHVEEADYTRTAFHPERGPVNFEDMVRNMATHGEHHLEQIEELKRAKGW